MFGSSSSDDDDDVQKLSVNKDYAARFEVRKQKQELARLREKHKDEELDDDDDEESEDEDARLLTPALDLEIFRTIDKIRNRQPEIYDKEKRFFEDRTGGSQDDDEDSNDAADHDEAPAARPKLTLKQQLLEQGATAMVSDDDDDEEYRPRGRVGAAVRSSLAYDEEQKRLRAAFIDEADMAVGGAGGDDEAGEGDHQASGRQANSGSSLLRRKTVSSEQRDKEQHDYSAWLRHELNTEHHEGTVDDSVTLRRYMHGEKLDENERFLRDYVLHAMWKCPAAAGGDDDDDDNAEEDRGDGRTGAGADAEGTMRAVNARAKRAAAAAAEADEEDEFSDRADDFERQHNFRYEEAGGGSLVGHQRHDASSVRRQTALSRKKEAEEARKARKAEARAQKEAELRRLKNLKKEEILGRLRAIEQVAGGATALSEVDLSGDFDPEAWDKRMAEVFNDDYYAAEDANFDAEDEDQGAASGARESAWQQDSWQPASSGAAAGFEELTARLKASGSGKTKMTVQQYMDEYYALDYEDLIAGELPTRFKYAPVAASGFGVTDEELLAIDEKTLAKRVPLRFIKRPFAKHDDVRLKNRANRERWEQRREERRSKASADAVKASKVAKKALKLKVASEAGEGGGSEGGGSEGGVRLATPSQTGGVMGGVAADGSSRERKRKRPSLGGSSATDGLASETGGALSERGSKKRKGKGEAAGKGSIASAEERNAPGSSEGKLSKAVKKGVSASRLQAFAKLHKQGKLLSKKVKASKSSTTDVVV